ncbi:hypothetical protein [Methylosinus sp. Sm6]|uniref:hypothetical protein n=1 Tax=Methylosinus sp. Sm6 TaxID=2866948 RepID=UPI001C9A0C9D|nr:hypothetical protein [Methylosinus sp. Sm6]MBY6243408.1 hypothetical protein [Methylosinus sp. Sm6]
MSRVDLFIFFIGASSRISVKLIGDLYICEIILAVVVAAGWRRIGGMFRNRMLKWAFILAGLWLLGQILTDVYRNTPFEDWSRGWAKIIFFMIDLMGLALSTRFRMRSAVLLSLGLGVAFLLQSILFPNQAQADGDFADGMWKFGVGAFFGAAAAALCVSDLLYRMIGMAAEYLPLLIAGVVNLAMNSRSAFGIAVAAAAAGAVTQFVARRPALGRRITLPRFVILLAFAALSGKGLVGIYEYAAVNHLLGEAALEKYQRQTSGSLGLLQAGRVESLASLEAIGDSPVIGHGSWAKDEKYVRSLYIALEDAGNANYDDIYRVDDFTIPTHSHILGSWVDAGIFGGVFWTYCLALIFAAAYVAFKGAATGKSRSTKYSTFVYYNLLGFAWAIPFSPFANSSRVSDAAVLIMIAATISLYSGADAARAAAQPSTRKISNMRLARRFAYAPRAPKCSRRAGLRPSTGAQAPDKSASRS